MEGQALWEKYSKYYLSLPSVGFAVDISRMRFDESWLPSMENRVQAAMDAMEALEQGEIANPDEQRMVGHYWLRAPKLAPNDELRTQIEDAKKLVKEFAAAVHSGKVRPATTEKFTTVLLIGIGGSALGPQLVADALGSAADKMKVLFLDNTDPDGFQRMYATLGKELASTLSVVISKSGGTVETANGMLEAAAAYQRLDLSFAAHAVAVTSSGSKLDQRATSEKWLRTFPMWDWVGGRTSLFSAVGLLPAALQGIDVDAFLSGAEEMDVLTRARVTVQNPAALLALMWFVSGEGKGKKDMVILPYKDRLVLMSKYLQQLVMESLGKERDLKGNVVHQGIAVYGNKGSTDQHAYVQQLRDCVNNFFATFLEVLSDYTQQLPDKTLEVREGVTSGDYLNGFFQGTRRALFENQRDSITITIDQLSAKSLGALIALFERAVGMYAALVGINAYHQPGVEAGKKAAEEVVALQQKVVAEVRRGGSQPRNVEAIAAACGSSDPEAVFKILEHLVQNKRFAILRRGDRSPKGATYSC
ncbi:MAG: glucose-6-phosphate isomerase [Deltaproteobacteria bacterium]|nr:glucose-6-phosphate isomerase [Deltaproteobacteria bacterium]